MNADHDMRLAKNNVGWRFAPLVMFVGAVVVSVACSDTDSNSGSGSGSSSGASSGSSSGDLGTTCDSWTVVDANEGSIREYFARFQMPVERNGCTTLHRPHSENRWNVFYPGRCAGCGIPNHIGAASFGDTLIVSWVASAAYQDTAEPNLRKFGHLSTFTFSEKDGFAKVSDFVFEQCDADMGEVTVSPDGSVIAALCLANRTDHAEKKNLILMEWTGGKITQTPDYTTEVSQSAGGWAGQWGLSLNKDLTHYNIAATTVLDGGHRGMTRFVWDRAARVKGPGESCGGGHPTTNRITHNLSSDTWSLFCRMDQKSINWVVNDATNQAGAAEQLGEWTTTDLSDTPGGLHNGISLGPGGWLVAATGPFDLFEGVPVDQRKVALEKQQFGLRRLPLTIAELRDKPENFPWRWIDRNRVPPPADGSKPLPGMVQLHNFGIGGEASGRILLGYSPVRAHTAASQFHAVEIDSDGNFLHAPVVLQRGGWGVDNVGTYMPNSGCVVFPYTWEDPAQGAPESGVRIGYPAFEQSVQERSEYLKLMALCPGGSKPAGPAPSCTTIRSQLTEAPEATKVPSEPVCPSF